MAPNLIVRRLEDTRRFCSTGRQYRMKNNGTWKVADQPGYRDRFRRAPCTREPLGKFTGFLRSVGGLQWRSWPPQS
jgi:hypothetical protein